MPITGLAFSHDDGLLLAATLNGEVVVWDIELGKIASVLSEPHSVADGTTRSVALDLTATL